QGQQLEQMVGHHVTQAARLLVVPGPLLDADRLAHGDLDVVDVAAVPDRRAGRRGGPGSTKATGRTPFPRLGWTSGSCVPAGARRTRRSSSRADSRSWPKGFSKMIRRQDPELSSVSPTAPSLSVISAKKSGGVAR